MLGFVEERLDLGVDTGAEGGPEFSTDITEVLSGFEARNVNWSDARGRWDIGDRTLLRPELDTLLAFFRARRGQAVGFRFKDWADFSADTSTGLLGTGAGTGLPSYQMFKRYTSAGENQDRVIKKPVASSISIYKNNAALASGWSLDDTSGLVTFSATASKAITGITQANPGVVTATAHGYASGQKIYLSGINGMTQLNNTVATITVIDANSFSVGVDTTAFSAYTDGGTAALYPQPGDTLAWSGEFDVAARFGTDRFASRFEAYRASDGAAIFYLASLPILEIRT